MMRQLRVLGQLDLNNINRTYKKPVGLPAARRDTSKRFKFDEVVARIEQHDENDEQQNKKFNRNLRINIDMVSNTYRECLSVPALKATKQHFDFELEDFDKDLSTDEKSTRKYRDLKISTDLIRSSFKEPEITCESIAYITDKRKHFDFSEL